jgi:hypothetical protein
MLWKRLENWLDVVMFIYRAIPNRTSSILAKFITPVLSRILFLPAEQSVHILRDKVRLHTTQEILGDVLHQEWYCSFSSLYFHFFSFVFLYSLARNTAVYSAIATIIRKNGRLTPHLLSKYFFYYYYFITRLFLYIRAVLTIYSSMPL